MRSRLTCKLRALARRADVFDGAQLAARRQHAPDLGEGRALRFDRAEDEASDRGVARSVGQWERLGPSGDNGHRHRRAAGTILGPPAQIRLRFNGRDGAHRRWKPAEVQAVAGADLDDDSAHARHQLVAIRPEVAVVKAAQEPVDAGEDRMVAGLAHSCARYRHGQRPAGGSLRGHRYTTV